MPRLYAAVPKYRNHGAGTASRKPPVQRCILNANDEPATGLSVRFFNVVPFVYDYWLFNDHSCWLARPVTLDVLAVV